MEQRSSGSPSTLRGSRRPLPLLPLSSLSTAGSFGFAPAVQGDARPHTAQARLASTRAFAQTNGYRMAAHVKPILCRAGSVMGLPAKVLSATADRQPLKQLRPPTPHLPEFGASGRRRRAFGAPVHNQAEIAAAVSSCALISAAIVAKAPFRRVRETRRERNAKVPARPTRIQPPPIRNDRGSCQQRDRPSNAPCPVCCRAGALHLQGQAGVPAAPRRVSRGATLRSPAARLPSHQGDAPILRAPVLRRFRQESQSPKSAHPALRSE